MGVSSREGNSLRRSETELGEPSSHSEDLAAVEDGRYEEETGSPEWAIEGTATQEGQEQSMLVV